MEIREKEFQELLEKISFLEDEIKSSRRKKIKSIKEFMSEECDFSKIDEALWGHIKGLAIAVHYKLNNHKYSRDRLYFHGEPKKRRSHDDLSEKELKFSAKVAEEILEIFNKYYEDLHE